MSTFGSYIRTKRQTLQAGTTEFSVRKVAAEIGVEPSFLSKVERDQQSPPSEAKIVALAEVLDEDPDVLLALAGKVSTDLKNIIRKRPALFGELIRQLKNMPENAVLRLVREVRDGNW